ncbi:MAG: carbonic anhydrase [Sphingomonas sp.]
MIFEQGLGELFVVRNAGNTAATTQSLGSVEYSVAKVGVPLILVLGHSRCGAVDAATSIVKDNTEFPGSIEAMVEPILPAALAVRGRPGDAVENGVYENVRRVAARLRSPEQPILYPPQRAGKLKVVGGVYDLVTGVVDFFDLPATAAMH